jgi:hypothetical protein
MLATTIIFIALLPKRYEGLVAGSLVRSDPPRYALSAAFEAYSLARRLRAQSHEDCGRS